MEIPRLDDRLTGKQHRYGYFTSLAGEEIIDAHFHSENPDAVDKAISLYADDISWPG
ncbi:hypothetical protein ACFYXF_39725 [Streptomyces sp. NPDC002680]|uniref:hypothetical protein n=1 Tax=Streptomyces sp. NPDC002680 TaxID=3364659 RepID=UPI0036803164